MEFLAPKFLILYMFAASVLYVHFRGQVRYGFFRQLTNYSTFLAPYSALMYLCSKVPTKPVISLDHFPELQHLTSNWETIRDEALKLQEQGDIRVSEKHEDVAFNSFFKRGWKRFYLKWYDDVLPTAKELCPKTVELVQSIPSINAAMFTMLPAGGGLPQHRDPFAGSLRYHLGLITPNSPDCRIYIDGKPYYWKDGEALLFDETYIHRAINETDQNRVILFCDVDRPLYTPIARGVNWIFTHHIAKMTSARNDDSEKIGIVNRISGPLYGLRGKAKALKKSNRTLYYALSYGGKLALLGGLLYWVFFDKLHGS